MCIILLLACTSSTLPPKDILFTFAFYNVENLFDLTDDPDKNDEDFLPNSDRKWDKEKYKLKLNNLAQAISKIGDDNGPEVLGLCEVENKEVLEDLVKQKAIKKSKYQIVHHESPDHRGIDNALIYKKGFFEFKASQTFEVDFPDEEDYTSRAILLVTGNIEGEEVNFIVNHFPSRRGGLQASEPRRIQAAKKLREITESILNTNPNAKIVIMGDFNDEPSNKSIKEILMAKGKDFDSKKNELFNAMMDLDNQGKGSYNYRGNWQMLDQIILSESIYNAKIGWGYINESANVFAPEWLKQQTPEKYKGTPLRTFAGKKYLQGFSDHFPVYINVEFKN